MIPSLVTGINPEAYFDDFNSQMTIRAVLKSTVP